VAQKFFPGLLDFYLGRTGYKSQQIQGEPKDTNASNNLYEYVPGIHSARGKFGDRSKSTSAEVFVTLHKNWFALGAVLALAAAGGAIASAKSSK
jgi:hypothetical protein